MQIYFGKLFLSVLVHEMFFFFFFLDERLLELGIVVIILVWPWKNLFFLAACPNNECFKKCYPVSIFVACLLQLFCPRRIHVVTYVLITRQNPFFLFLLLHKRHYQEEKKQQPLTSVCFFSSKCTIWYKIMQSWPIRKLLILTDLDLMTFKRLLHITYESVLSSRSTMKMKNELWAEKSSSSTTTWWRPSSPLRSCKRTM